MKHDPPGEPIPVFTGQAADLTDADRMVVKMLRGAVIGQQACIILPSGRRLTAEAKAALDEELS